MKRARLTSIQSLGILAFLLGVSIAPALQADPTPHRTAFRILDPTYRSVFEDALIRLEKCPYVELFELAATGAVEPSWHVVTVGPMRDIERLHDEISARFESTNPAITQAPRTAPKSYPAAKHGLIVETSGRYGPYGYSRILADSFESFPHSIYVTLCHPPRELTHQLFPDLPVKVLPAPSCSSGSNQSCGRNSRARVFIDELDLLMGGNSMYSPPKQGRHLYPFELHVETGSIAADTGQEALKLTLMYRPTRAEVGAQIFRIPPRRPNEVDRLSEADKVYVVTWLNATIRSYLGNY